MNRLLLIPAVCALALTAACDGRDSVRISSTRTDSDGKGEGVLKVASTLQCPQTQGTLTRKGAASAGGPTCTYVGPRGTEVVLHLVPLDGSSPAEVMQAFEDRLSTSLPQAVDQLQASADEARAQAEADRAEAAAAQAEIDAQAAAGSGDRARITGPGLDIRAEGDDATVRMPGLHIEADGDTASVRIGGFHIDANDASGTVNIEGSDDGDSISVQAQNDTAEIRTSGSGAATRASWILTDNRASPAGWRLVGYEARGPVGGPLVIATIRSRDRDRGRAFEDAKDLVTLNVGE